MIERLVTLCFQRRGIVQLVFLLAALYGWYCWNQLPLEVDTSKGQLNPSTSQMSRLPHQAATTSMTSKASGGTLRSRASAARAPLPRLSAPPSRRGT